jgi:hypothetical protein
MERYAYMLKWHRDKVVFHHGELRTDPTTKPAIEKRNEICKEMK